MVRVEKALGQSESEVECRVSDVQSVDLEATEALESSETVSLSVAELTVVASPPGLRSGTRSGYVDSFEWRTTL